MFRELTGKGYYLVYIDESVGWCFGNEYLGDDEFLLDGVSGLDKNEVIKNGYEKYKNKL